MISRSNKYIEDEIMQNRKIEYESKLTKEDSLIKELIDKRTNGVQNDTYSHIAAFIPKNGSITNYKGKDRYWAE